MSHHETFSTEKKLNLNHQLTQMLLILSGIEIFTFVAVLVFKLFFLKVLFINRKNNKVGYFLRK